MQFYLEFLRKLIDSSTSCEVIMEKKLIREEEKEKGEKEIHFRQNFRKF